MMDTIGIRLVSTCSARCWFAHGEVCQCPCALREPRGDDAGQEQAADPDTGPGAGTEVCIWFFPLRDDNISSGWAAGQDVRSGSNNARGQPICFRTRKGARKPCAFQVSKFIHTPIRGNPRTARKSLAGGPPYAQQEPTPWIMLTGNDRHPGGNPAVSSAVGTLANVRDRASVDILRRLVNNAGLEHGHDAGGPTPRSRGSHAPPVRRRLRRRRSWTQAKAS